MYKLAARVIVYSIAVLYMACSLPLTGQIKDANILTRALWLRGDIQAVTMPWGGILIKTGITGTFRDEVLNHEQCHVSQINKFGAISFMFKYQSNPGKFEKECYK